MNITGDRLPDFRASALTAPVGIFYWMTRTDAATRRADFTTIDYNGFLICYSRLAIFHTMRYFYDNDVLFIYIYAASWYTILRRAPSFGHALSDYCKNIITLSSFDASPYDAVVAGRRATSATTVAFRGRHGILHGDAAKAAKCKMQKCYVMASIFGAFIGGRAGMPPTLPASRYIIDLRQSQRPWAARHFSSLHAREPVDSAAFAGHRSDRVSRSAGHIVPWFCRQAISITDAAAAPVLYRLGDGVNINRMLFQRAIDDVFARRWRWLMRRRYTSYGHISLRFLAPLHIYMQALISLLDVMRRRTRTACPPSQPRAETPATDLRTMPRRDAPLEFHGDRKNYLSISPRPEARKKGSIPLFSKD